ncbi:RICIN domain-containing protein [Bradyrhizobium elkanii]|uniref:RICIN domain-containing protein n=1 Tax=Bradyrhizobium elkanii TaxID=29448 RepID=UPI0020A21EC4|nr:ricin-type beta-trefoil lectin domain protein [Bradyrhizobium elkanii]MCP1926391.1 hypothetical protein [Bradyrhizobium elkanii]
MGSYIIKYKANEDFVIGVHDQAVGAPIVLRKRHAALRYIVWDIDLAAGSIRLHASDRLALAPSGNAIREARLYLQFYDAANPNQQWEFGENPGPIYSLVNRNLCVDNNNSRQQEGNPIWLYPENGTVAQKWQHVPLSGLRATDLEVEVAGQP